MTNMNRQGPSEARNPNPHEFFADNIPAELKNQDAWILWHGEYNEKGKLEKRPHTVRGGMASSTNPETWSTWERVAEVASERNDVLGPGFVFDADSAFGGMDLDGCRNPETGEIKASAREILDATPSYAEASPSLTGIKIIGTFELPLMSGHKKLLNEETGEAIEVYDRGRFFTVTGLQIPGTPSEVRDIQIPVEGVLGRYFAKPQRVMPTEYAPREVRELTEAQRGAAVRAIADNLPENHLQDLAMNITGFLRRHTHRETVEEIMIAAWDAHGLIKVDGSGLKDLIRRAEERLENGENVTGGPSLKKRNPDMYAALVAALDEGEAPKAADGNQSQRLIGYAMGAASELFLDQNGTEHALIDGAPVPLDSGCYGWLRRLFWEHEEAAATTDLLGTAAGMLRAFAEASGIEHVLHLRAAQHGGAVYLYLRPGRVVRVDSRGWEIDPNPPVMFRRVANLKDLPDPERGGSLDLLDDFITAQEDRDHRLAKAWLALALLADVNRPILLAHGPQGATKSSVQRVLKNVIDPGRPESLKLREKDFEQNINKAFIPFFDNVSTITDYMADEVSKAVTGAGNAVRKLYADDEDIIREYRRAILLNGLVIPTDKPDLIDRVLPVALRRVPKAERRTERHMKALFDERHPKLLGAVLDALSGALANHEEIEGLPRLADWAEYAIALYKHLDWGGYDGFMNDWAVIEEGQHATTLEASVLAQSVIAVVNEHGDISRAPKDMLELLRNAARSEGLDPDSRENDFPGGVSWLSKRLVPIVPTLEAYRVKVEDGRENSKERKRFIRFYRPGGGNPDGSGQHSDSIGQHTDSIASDESPIDMPNRTARTARTAYLPENSKYPTSGVNNEEALLQGGQNAVRTVRKRRRRRKSAQVSQSASDSKDTNAVRNTVRNEGDAVREDARIAELTRQGMSADLAREQVRGDADPLAERRAQRRAQRLKDIHDNAPERYHELPAGERDRLREWLHENAAPRQVTGSRDSYFLKHVVERFFRERGDRDPYVSNPAIKGALLEAGYEPVWDDRINMGFRVGPRPGSAWAGQPHGPRVLCGALLCTPAPIPEYPASRARRQKQWLRK